MARYRIDQDYDYDAISPLEWDDSAVIVRSSSNRPEHLNLDANVYAQDVVEASENAYMHGQDYIAAALKHAQRNKIEAHRLDFEPIGGGYINGVFVGPKSTLEAWRQYMDGEVYIVSLQRETVWTSVTGEIRTTREPVDYIGGCYLSDEYTKLDAAKDYFDIEGKELVE